MHRRQHDASLTTLNAGGANTGHIVDVVALTDDDGLLATLQDAISAEHALWHAPSADAAVELLVGGRCGILIVDLQAIMRSDGAALLERLQTQFPELVLLATGRREEEGTVARLISKGCVYRFLHKPVSPARANLFLATATRRYHELSDNASPAPGTVKHLTRPSQRIRLIAGIIAAAIFILALTLLWSHRNAQPVVPSTAGSTAAATPQAAPSVEDQLAAAQAALAAGRMSPPETDNALDHYRAVLSVQADNAAALAGVRQILDALATRVTTALQKRDAPAAKQALMTLQAAQPDHQQLDALRAQLLALSRSAKPETSAAPAKAPAPAKKTTAARNDLEREAEPDLRDPRTSDQEINEAAATASDTTDQPVSQPVTDQSIDDQLARAVKLRTSNQLIEPEGDNAYDVLNSIAAQNTDAPEVRAERQRLVFALLENTRTALAAGDLDHADALLTRADQLVPGMANTKALQQQLAAAREERAAASTTENVAR